MPDATIIFYYYPIGNAIAAGIFSFVMAITFLYFPHERVFISLL